MKQPDLVLVDGSSYLYRAFHALPPLTTADGRPTGAVYGVGNMLRRLRKDYADAHIAVVFDAPGKTFRDELFEDYKAHRPPMPDDLRDQIDPLLSMVEALGLPLLRESGVEADDVIGTLAREAASRGQQVLISTGDKDMAQLVDEHITLVNTMTGKFMDRAGVEEKFGIPPERIIDYLALVGDKSDNIPGVPKVGPKTAVKWLKEFGDLDQIMARADEVKGKVGESLRENIEQLKLSRELATIRLDLDMGVSESDLKLGEADVATLRELYRSHEFNSWLRELDEGSGNAVTASPDQAGAGAAEENNDYQVLLKEAELDEWIKRLKQTDLMAVDTETTSIHYRQAELVGLSFAIEPGEAAYLPLAHDYEGAPTQIDRATALKKLKPLLEDPNLAKVGHHIKYDMHVLAGVGIRLAGVRHDSMLASYVLDSTATRHDMDSVAQKYLGITPISYEAVAGKGVKQKTFNQIELDTAGPYAAEDADITLRLHQAIQPRLEAIPNLARVYQDLEMPLVPILQGMEERGVMVDADKLREQSAELKDSMDAIERQAHDLAGQNFNLGSPKQLQKILFEDLELPVVRKTPKGQPSTAEDVLEELAVSHELPHMILEHRGLSKLRSTYTDKLPQMIDPRSGRVHTSYHQAVAATGRLSSSDPNLQNIPIRRAEGRRIRKAFIAPEGQRLVAADYSQIELRIMAHLSGDKGLLKAFEQDLDIHSATAAEVFGGKAEAVAPDQRRAAKAINFGLIYGMSAWGLARQLGIERQSAQEYVNRYFERYPGVAEYMDRTRRQAHEQGYVETVFGRRLYLPEINSRNGQRRQYAERTAINAPMQGSAADIIKRAMLDVAAWLSDEWPEVWMIMQVHDELVFEVPEQQTDAFCRAVAERMSQAAELSVPLRVDAESGVDWEEAH
ncbi:DNA polymerase-1 [Natronospira proteinivora]|uniref:DNA polymerase I n=1 Tax=Natronospira proteinivora TaxID=1807133 RepID=A0ABT1G9Z0_9GAMM|nr:DNA polymerase I [Natronospira proteinivora]MCP1728150.1 DNA polymerase-1 [Natronospira proteinivora]